MTGTVARDLGKHFRDRVATVIEDSIDTSFRAEIPSEETSAYIVGHLIALAAVVAVEHDVGRGDFLRGAAEVYDRMTKTRPQR
jgi:hypothetical protein